MVGSLLCKQDDGLSGSSLLKRHGTHEVINQVLLDFDLLPPLHYCPS